jgi:cation:H+ antiporter
MDEESNNGFRLSASPPDRERPLAKGGRRPDGTAAMDINGYFEAHRRAEDIRCQPGRYRRGMIPAHGQRGRRDMAGLLALGGVGLVLLTVAADQLVVGAGRLAARLRVAPVVVGVVVIGIGTSVPEFLVSGVAAAQGHVGLAVGNLAGSNLVNVTLVLGVAGLVAPVAVRSSVIRREAPLSVAAVVVFAAAIGLGLGWVTGTVLAVLAALALVVLVRLARLGQPGPLAGEVREFLHEPPPHGLTAEATRTLLGLAGTLAGAELLVHSAATLAVRWGVPPSMVGFTLVALGTSLPD